MCRKNASKERSSSLAKLDCGYSGSLLSVPSSYLFLPRLSRIDITPLSPVMSSIAPTGWRSLCSERERERQISNENCSPNRDHEKPEQRTSRQKLVYEYRLSDMIILQGTWTLMSLFVGILSQNSWEIVMCPILGNCFPEEVQLLYTVMCLMVKTSRPNLLSPHAQRFNLTLDLCTTFFCDPFGFQGFTRN